MLKIKDNVDLKELEKYGFKYNEYGDLCKELKQEYYRILEQSGIFNLKSDWWKVRFK